MNDNKEVVLRYLEAVEQGYYHKSILEVGRLNDCK